MDWGRKAGFSGVGADVGRRHDRQAVRGIDPQTKEPQSNGARKVIVGVALPLAGFGFAVLSIGGALRNPETVFRFLHKPGAKPGATVAPAA